MKYNLIYSFQVVIAKALLRAGGFLPRLKMDNTTDLVDGRSWLTVRPSLIEDAGNGLFTTRAITKGDGICRYIGTHKNLFEVLRTTNKHYLFMLGYNSYIDAHPHEKVLGRFVNHHFDHGCRNVDFEERDNEIWYVATRDIQAGEELYTDYEPFYWDVLE
jgi:hypothetical protein